MKRIAACVLACAPLWAALFAQVQGVVHDPSHRPVANAEITVKAKQSDFQVHATSDASGAFEAGALPAGEYVVTVSRQGFAVEQSGLLVESGTAPLLHIQLKLAEQRETVTVRETTDGEQPVTPDSMVNRSEIQNTPGADLTNSMRMITDFVPGAYMTHDQLHIRGGHQVTWAIDGVPIPNTNIASSVGPQIDPKDIDTLEVERGGYSADSGDRTYGVLNVVPRTGFESNRDLNTTATYGTFQQTNDQVSLGDHTQRFAWFGSLDGNRSNYGLETPGPMVQHDAEWGLSGFASLIYNMSPSDQFRVTGAARRDDYQVPDSGDNERERDDFATFTWLHSFSPGLILTVSPFFHFNETNYAGAANTQPVSTTQRHDSTYGGAQVAIGVVKKSHDFRAGLYSFGEHDNESIRIRGEDSSVAASAPQTGGLEAGFLEDQWRTTPWLTLTGGLRMTHYAGSFSEGAMDPRAGAAIKIPRLNWTLRGFYGAYYEPPPLQTISGPLEQYAVSQGLGIIPLKGERDEENQVGLSMPLHGWTADVNSFRLRATNYFDHNSIGDSNVFLPLTIAGARIWGEEFTLRSPRLFHRGELSIAYSHQHAEAEGAITGGLTDFSPAADGYFLLDHDQRHTLHVNGDVRLPGKVMLAVAAYYGSGFTDGSAGHPAHLPGHTTFDAVLGREFGERVSLSLNALNVANRRFLLDNSSTFGGTHYAEPRQIYLQLRYRLRL